MIRRRTAKSKAEAREHLPKRVPVILDTDIGDDIDDTWALAMLLGCAQVEVKLIVTATDDTPRKTRLAAKILERLGRTDIPIATGVENGRRELAQAAWLGDYDLGSYSGSVFEDGVGAMVELVEKATETVTIVAIGPQTDLAEALRRRPSIAGKARVVAMAGSIRVGYGGKRERDAEYNVKRDIEAARAVLGAPWEVTIAPLDGCGDVILRGERYARVKNSTAARARVVIENYDAWAGRARYPAGESSVLFDTVAAYLAFDETCTRMETVKLVIDDAGNTIPYENGREVRCQMGWRDRDGFEELLVTSLAK